MYNKSGEFEQNCNKELVLLSSVSQLKDIDELHTMLENHLRYTQSTVAKQILDNWETELNYFVKVIPKDYKTVMEILEQEQQKGIPQEEAVMHAFEEAIHRKAMK